jgi:hypothetical protein
MRGKIIPLDYAGRQYSASQPCIPVSLYFTSKPIPGSERGFRHIRNGDNGKYHEKPHNKCIAGSFHIA